MDYLKPAEVVTAMVEAGTRKAALSATDLLVRGALSGAILGIATQLAITAAVQTGVPLVGALIFPVGFVMIVLLNLELVTGSFAVLPMAQMDNRIGFAQTLRNWAYSYAGNLAGSLLYAGLAWGALTTFGETAAGPVGERIAAIADAKTVAYAAHGGAGWAAAFAKAMLCNWMVCMGVVMSMVGQSTVSKIAARRQSPFRAWPGGRPNVRANAVRKPLCDSNPLPKITSSSGSPRRICVNAPARRMPRHHAANVIP